MPGLLVNEIFYSIQGESTWAGRPCAFVRLAGCNLRCAYCDTEYAFYAGQRRSVEEVIEEVQRISGGCQLVEVTGGEPLLQPAVHELMRRLCDAGKTVLLETSGACDIAPCDPRPRSDPRSVPRSVPRIIRIMDLKTPGSGEVERNLWSNIDHLRQTDEVKFVLCSRADYDWACRTIREHHLDQRVNAVLLSAAAAMPPGKELAGVEGLSLRELAQWVLADKLGGNIRLQTQLHKIIWDPATRGV